MTRYLHFIVNSRHSWNSSVFVHDQDMNELLFSRDNLKALNGVLFWPVPFVPSVVVFSDAPPCNGCAAFIQGTDLGGIYMRPGRTQTGMSTYRPP